VTPTNSWWDWDHAFAVLPDLLLIGFKNTLLATVVGTLIALVLGLIVAMIRRSAPAIIATPFTWVVEFIRMTPLVVQLVFANLVLSPYIDSTLAIGIGVLGIHYMTYMAEVYRAGIDSVPTGQIRNTLPALGNYAISMFKETPFFVVIYIPELVRVAQNYGSTYFRYTEAITLAGLIFLAASYPTSLLIRRLEKKLA
jgi:polar amino acid transport system permease protein